MPPSDDRPDRARRRRPHKPRARSVATRPAPATAEPSVDTRGHWRLTAIADAAAVFARLAALLPGATHIVTAGDRRSWAGAAGVLDETPGDMRPTLAQGEQLLHFSPRALELLALAARTDAPTPFCRELRIHRDGALLARWATPPSGELRIAASVATSGVWLLATTARAAHAWRPEQP